MTDPTPDADRQEQLAELRPDPAGRPALADDVPVADAVEQSGAAPSGPDTLSVEADEYDVLEQRAELPDDDDDHTR